MSVAVRKISLLLDHLTLSPSLLVSLHYFVKSPIELIVACESTRFPFWVRLLQSVQCLLRTFLLLLHCRDMGTCTTRHPNDQDVALVRQNDNASASKVSWCSDIEPWRRVQVFAHWMRYIDAWAAWTSELSDIISRYIIGTEEWFSNFGLGDTSIQIKSSPFPGVHSLCSLRMFSAASLHSLSWELQVKQKGNSPCFMMGFIDADYIGHFDQQQWIGNSSGFALYIQEGQYSSCFARGRRSILHKKWKYCSNAGDRFRLDLDFETQECKAHYNDQFLGVFHPDYVIHPRGRRTLPQRVYLSVSVRSCHSMTQVFETTLLTEKYRTDH